jgi:hypothetical protein
VSWKPLVKSNARAVAITSTSTIELCTAGVYQDSRRVVTFSTGFRH